MEVYSVEKSSNLQSGALFIIDKEQYINQNVLIYEPNIETFLNDSNAIAINMADISYNCNSIHIL